MILPKPNAVNDFPNHRGAARLALAALLVTLLPACQKRDAVSVQAAAAAPPSQVDASQIASPQESHSLPRYELQIAPSDFAALENDPSSNNTRPATFKANGKVFAGVKVRVRGSWSRSWPKKSLKILFEHSNPFEGHHSLNLNSGWRDPAFVREPLAYHVYAACGVPAPQCRMVRLDINGQFGGVYVQVEQPEKAFLARIGMPGGSVYKAVSRGRDADERDLGNDQAYQASYDKETQKNGGYTELAQFCRELESSPDKLDFFNRNIDLEHYVNYLAATVLIQHWDGFNKNHFLVYDGRGSKKWLVVPWDLDRTFGDHWNWSFQETRLPVLLGTRRQPGITGWNRLEDRFLSVPSLRAKFLDRLSELLEKEFTPQKLFPVLDQLESEIAVDGVKDRRKWPSSDPDFHSGIAQVKAFIEQRRAYLVREVARLRDGA
jgi:spore coat protein H